MVQRGDEQHGCDVARFLLGLHAKRRENGRVVELTERRNTETGENVQASTQSG